MHWREALTHKQIISRNEPEDGIAALLTESSAGQEVGIIAQHPGEHPIQAHVPRRSAHRVLEELNIPLEGWQ
jgi:hypothetical protein